MALPLGERQPTKNGEEGFFRLGQMIRSYRVDTVNRPFMEQVYCAFPIPAPSLMRKCRERIQKKF
jgi:hypothetical protein